MNPQMTFVERRQRPRVGILAEIENITYKVLREQGVDNPSAQTGSADTPEQSA